MWTPILLVISNIFMTLAWYGHLKWFGHDKGVPATPMWLIILASWGIAFIEYCFAVPANRIGNQAGWSTAQLKVTQEVITLAVFAVFSVLFLKEKIQWNHLVAFMLVIAAVFFVFYVKPQTPA